MGSYTLFMDEQGQEERDIVCIARLFAGYKRSVNAVHYGGVRE